MTAMAGACSGAVSGTVAVTYDNDLRVRTQTVGDTPPVALDYDEDGLPTRVGDLTMALAPASGRLTGTSLGGLSDTWGYDAHGEPVSYSAPGLLAITWVRAALGRVVEQTETVQGETHTWRYGYAEPA